MTAGYLINYSIILKIISTYFSQKQTVATWQGNSYPMLCIPMMLVSIIVDMFVFNLSFFYFFFYLLVFRPCSCGHVLSGSPCLVKTDEFLV